MMAQEEIISVPFKTKRKHYLGKGNRMIEITGYAYKKGQKIERFNSDFVIKNIETGNMLAWGPVGGFD